MFVEVLTEGTSDVPVLKEILTRKFGLSEDLEFRIHPHRGKGTLPRNPLARADSNHRGLLDQLPAKLRAYGHYMDNSSLVLVVIDADDDNVPSLLKSLETLLDELPTKPPRVLFRIAVEETESWFIADARAVKAAFPGARLGLIQGIRPDSVIGAWEKLAECIGVQAGAGPEKLIWATKIAPHLDLDTPPSPSLAGLVDALQIELSS